MQIKKRFLSGLTPTLIPVCLAATFMAVPSLTPASADDTGRAPIRYLGAQPEQGAQPAPATTVAERPATAAPTRLTATETMPRSGLFDARKAAARLASQPVEEPHRVAPRNIAQQYTPQSAPAQEPQTVSEDRRATRLAGTGFSPVADTSYDATGTALIYNADFFGEPTASGEVLNENSLTAAHPTLPLPSLVQVINVETGREIVVRVNDRGPFNNNGLIELTPRAASLLGLADGGSDVRIRYLGPAERGGTPASLQPRNVSTADTKPPSRITELPMPPVETPAPQTASAPERNSLVEDLARPATPEPLNAVKLEEKPIMSLDLAPKGAANYFVQVGSFSQLENAMAFREDLISDHNVGIVEVNVRGRDYYRVVVGPFDFKATATETRSRLKRQGIDGIVIPAKAR